MPNGDVLAGRNREQYKILEPISQKINFLNNRLPKIKKKWEEIINRQREFENEIGNADIYLALLCLLALLFDFIVSRITMVPLTKSTNISPEIMALIFNLMDGIIAILASGILAKDALGKFKAKKIWPKVLWLLCAVKIALYIGFAYSKVTIIGMLFIMFLVVIVYIILHFAGGGLFYLIGKIKFAILKNWHEDPDIVDNKLNDKCRELRQEVMHNDFDLVEVMDYFNFEVGVKLRLKKLGGVNE